MRRLAVLGGILGLVLSARVPASAQDVTILGQKYTVTVSPRHGTFKNGTTVNLQKGGGDIADADVPKKATLAFAPGASPEADRLFVGAAHQDALGPTSDGFYMLQGADANGVFSPQASNAFVFFRGDREVHGRIQNVVFLNDTDTGSMKDRNLYAYTFTSANMIRFYDLSDLMAGTRTDEGAFRKLTLFRIIQANITEEVFPPDPAREELPDDPNMPAGGYMPAALAPNGALIVASAEGGEIYFSALDPLKGTAFYPVKTATAATPAVDKINPSEFPHALVRLRGDEYLMLATDPDSGTNAVEADLNSQTLYHLRITLPADLTREAPDSIKVEVLGTQDVPALKLGQSPTAKMFGLAVGREVSSGRPILYMADWAGNLFTLRPAQ